MTIEDSVKQIEDIQEVLRMERELQGGFMALTVFEYDDYVSIQATAHLPHPMLERPDPCYDQDTKFLGKKKFFNDEDRMKLFAHKLQSYAMELLDEEE